MSKRARQRNLLNLGSRFNFPREQWPELAQRVEQILVGQNDLPAPYPEAVEHSNSRTVGGEATSILTGGGGGDKSRHQLILASQKGYAYSRLFRRWRRAV